MIIWFLQIPMWILLGWLVWYVKSRSWRGRRSPFNENLLRLPGHSARSKHMSALVDVFIYMFGVFSAPYFFYALAANSTVSTIGFLITAILVVAFSFYKCVKGFKFAIQMHVGVEAEVVTGQELNMLMHEGAWVFHDIPYQYGNIDHIIVSSGGVFAIETKGVTKPTSGD